MQMHFKANRVTEKRGEAAEGGKRRLSLTKRDEDAGLVNLKSLPHLSDRDNISTVEMHLDCLLIMDTLYVSMWTGDQHKPVLALARVFCVASYAAEG